MKQQLRLSFLSVSDVSNDNLFLDFIWFHCSWCRVVSINLPYFFKVQFVFFCDHYTHSVILENRFKCLGEVRGACSTPNYNLDIWCVSMRLTLIFSITKTYLYNFNLLKPHFYIVKFRFIMKIRLFKYIKNFTTKKWKFSDEKFWYLFLFLLKT